MKEGRQGRSEAPFYWRGRRRSWGGRVEFILFVAGCLLVIFYRPVAHVSAFRAFEERHGRYLLDDFVFVAIWCVGRLLYLHFFRRGQWVADQADIRAALRQDRVKRMPLWGRWLLILCFLGLIILGWMAPPPHHTRLLALGVPLFLLFCAVELNLVMHPGETLLPDPRDELLAFFKSRMLQAGYVAAIAALAAAYLVYLFAPAYIGLLLPLVLAVCLLVPSLVYIRLDRRAAADG